MTYRVTLQQNLPNRAPSAFEMTYTFREGPAQTWPVTNVSPDRDAAAVTLDCAQNLMPPGVLTRTLRAHYPTPPTEVDVSVSSVQPA